MALGRHSEDIANGDAVGAEAEPTRKGPKKPGREVDMESVPELLRGMDGRFPTPWAFGVHNAWLEITPATITGRRLAAERTASAF